jgi:eukaryotic-like serine/threonine-protein kinase
MELVEGEDLSQRITRGAIPLDEALPIARQIAEALEAAHEQSIIHRDLKPANIKVRPDGTVKVLDFGLAKVMEPTGVASPSVSQSPTITTPAMTHAGMILGTAAYMSPEQARGKQVDKRADIWAFGCVLYEMLTGKRAFGGEDVSLTLADVMKGEADWQALPATLAPGIRTVLTRGDVPPAVEIRRRLM